MRLEPGATAQSAGTALVFRAILIGTSIACVSLVIPPCQWIAITLRLPVRRKIPMLYHGIMCRLIDIQITTVGAQVKERPLLIVANHVSLFDIPVIGSVAPVVFVAKREIADWFFFGWLTKLGRSVFVDRVRRQKTQHVNAEIGQMLADGDPVVLFGEGTSSDGNRVLPFRTALIGAARDALARSSDIRRVWIQPLSIAYTRLHGFPLGRQHRPIIAWYGDSGLWPHFIGVISRGAIDVVLTWGEPIAFDETSDRKAVAKALETSVRQHTARALRSA